MIHDKMFADILKKYDSLDGQEYTAKKGKTSLNEASNMHDVLGRLNLLESGYPADTNQLRGEDDVESPKGPVGKLVGEAEEEEMADNDHDFFAKMNEKFSKPSFAATAQETLIEKILDALSKCTDPVKKNKLVDLATRAGAKPAEINNALHPTTESESIDQDGEEQLDEYRFHYGMTKQQMTPDYAKALAKRHFDRKLRDDEFKKTYGTDAYDKEYERLKRDAFYGKPEQRESIDESDDDELPYSKSKLKSLLSKGYGVKVIATGGGYADSLEAGRDTQKASYVKGIIDKNKIDIVVNNIHNELMHAIDGHMKRKGRKLQIVITEKPRVQDSYNPTMLDEFDQKFNEAFGEEETIDPFDEKYEQKFSQEDEIEEGTHEMINSLATLASDEWENTKKRYNDEFMQDTPPKSQSEEHNQEWFKSVLDRLFGNDERVNAR